MIPQHGQMIASFEGYFQGVGDVKNSLENFNQQISLIKNLNANTAKQNQGFIESTVEVSKLIQQTKSQIISQLDQIESKLK